jgi:Reverse transcriptase (RNA-dependent DNA polymerase)
MTSNIEVKTLEMVLRRQEKLFGHLKLADTRGELDFNNKLQKLFVLRQTRIPLVTLDQQKSPKDTIGELLNLGMIRTVVSKYPSPIVVVKKKDGIDRACINYSELNSPTNHDIYPIPIMETLFKQMTHFKVFFKLDLRSAYHKAIFTQRTEKLTAFRCMYGTFCNRVLLLGTTNAPSHFQRFLEFILSGMLNTNVFVYLDNIMIAT